MKSRILSLVAALIATFSLTSCGSLTGGTDPIVGDIIDVGAITLALQYPQYATEINTVAALLAGNADSADLQAIIDSYLDENIDNPALQAAIKRLVSRVIARTTPDQQPKAIEALAAQMKSAVSTAD